MKSADCRPANWRPAAATSLVLQKKHKTCKRDGRARNTPGEEVTWSFFFLIQREIHMERGNREYKDEVSIEQYTH